MLLSDPETVVKVVLKSWTQPLDAEAGPTRIELQLATTEHDTDLSAGLTPGEARAVAAALLEVVGIAQRTDEE